MTINIGLIGLGTVGGGVYNLLKRKSETINSRVGCDVKIKKVCDLRQELKKDLGIPEEIFTTEFRDIIDDDEISLVVELTGNPEFAFEIISESFKKSKHVVTANKALLATRWPEIFSLARKNNCLIYFEASVGSGIPVIQGINEGLIANRIDEIKGVLNGTTNYILTVMSKSNSTFETALETAIDEGFAEPDASADINGLDAAHKICILANVINTYPVDFNDIYCEGIGDMQLVDIKYATDMFGFNIKLLAVMKRHENSVEIRIHPALLPKEHMLASVNYENNGILVKGDAVGQVMFYGKGAGRYPAASAVVSDVIYLAQKINNNIAGDIPYIPYIHTSGDDKTQVLCIDELEFQYYLRFTTVDKPGVLSRISGILGMNNISIVSCFQKGYSSEDEVHILMVTHKANEGSLKKSLEEINGLDVVKKKSVYIRIESEEEIC
ncbi:MAG: homoserine dehydrogenase [Elusimicrobiota bacterium]